MVSTPPVMVSTPGVNSSSHGVNSSSHGVNSSSHGVDNCSCGINTSDVLTSQFASVGGGGLRDAGSFVLFFRGESRSYCSSSSFSIVYYNARSLLPKMDELVALVSASCPAVVCIVETWLCDYILDSEICLPDYATIRLDRNRHDGGVLMYVHSSLDFNVLFRGYSDIELLAVSISINRLITFASYRPPSSPAHFLIFFLKLSVS